MPDEEATFLFSAGCLEIELLGYITVSQSYPGRWVYVPTSGSKWLFFVTKQQGYAFIVSRNVARSLSHKFDLPGMSMPGNYTTVCFLYLPLSVMETYT